MRYSGLCYLEVAVAGAVVAGEAVLPVAKAADSVVLAEAALVEGAAALPRVVAVAGPPPRPVPLPAPVAPLPALPGTAAGLAVAIPAVVAYNLMGRRLARLDSELEGLAYDLRALAQAKSLPTP